jgi:hypothetical protein
MTRTGVSTTVEKRGGRPAIGGVVILAVLMWSGVYAAEVQNPSFEAIKKVTPYPRYLPQGWTARDNLLSFNSGSTSQWSTDGNLSVELLSRIGRPISAGECQGLYQGSVDLTGIRAVEFDVRTLVGSAAVSGHFEASFLVDGVPLWKQNAAGLYLDQQVNVAGMAGPHRIEIRLTALDAGTFSASCSAQWDNVRLIEGPRTIPAIVDLNPSTLSAADDGTGTLSAASNGSGTLNPASNGKWITCHIELGADYDVNEIDGASVTLNDIPAYLGDQGWATPQANAGNVADDDGDGVLERMVKFDRAAVQAIVQPPEATVTIKGRLVDGPLFEGTAVIRVPDKKGKKD